MNRPLSIRITDGLIFSLILAANLIEETVRAVGDAFGVNIPFISILNYFIYGLALLLYIILRLNGKTRFRSLYLVFSISIVFIICFYASIIINKEIASFQTEFYHSLGPIIMYLMIGCISVDDSVYLDSFVTHLKKFVPISIFYGVMTVFVLSRIDTYYMTMSYIMLPWVIVSYMWYQKKRKFWYLVEFLIQLFIIGIFGNRFSILIIGTFMVMYAHFFSSWNKKRIILIFIVPLVTLLSYFFLEYFLAKIATVSRVATHLLSNTFFLSNRRVEIYRALWDRFSNNPFEIRGLYSDRIEVYNTLVNYYYNHSLEGLYAHNFFLELLVDFGVFGIIPIFTFLFLVIRVYRILRTRDHGLMALLIFFLTTGFLPLLVSNSFTRYPMFWALMGFLLVVSLKRKDRRLFSRSFPTT